MKNVTKHLSEVIEVELVQMSMKVHVQVIDL